METYVGQVRTPADAIVLFEACRQGLLPRVQRRLSEKERQQIKSGSVFVWDEREAGMRRWTDGKSWSASRVSGSFLTYREMEGKRGGGNFPGSATSTPVMSRGTALDSTPDLASSADAPDGYRYKPDGLVKQSFSITTTQGANLHLISYFARSHPSAATMPLPTTDPQLRAVRVPKDLYRESTVEASPATIRSPMVGAHFSSSPHPAMHAAPSAHARPSPSMRNDLGPGYGWPPSPISTPPAHHHPPHLLPDHRASPNHHPQMHHHTQHQAHMHHQPRAPGPTAFDRVPPPMSNLGGVPAPPPPFSHQRQQYHHHHHHHPPRNALAPLTASNHLRNPSPRSLEPLELSHRPPLLHTRSVDAAVPAIDPQLAATPSVSQPSASFLQRSMTLSDRNPCPSPVGGPLALPNSYPCPASTSKTIPSITSLMNPSTSPLPPPPSQLPPQMPPSIDNTPNSHTAPPNPSISSSRKPGSLGSSMIGLAMSGVQQAGPQHQQGQQQQHPPPHAQTAGASNAQSADRFALRQLDRAFAA